jgi:hypothetical protein
MGLSLMANFLYGTLERIEIYFDADESIDIRRQIFGRQYLKLRITNASSLRTKISFAWLPFTQTLQLKIKRQKHLIAILRTPDENKWLKSEIDNYIDRYLENPG